MKTIMFAVLACVLTACFPVVEQGGPDYTVESNLHTNERKCPNGLRCPMPYHCSLSEGQYACGYYSDPYRVPGNVIH